MYKKEEVKQPSGSDYVYVPDVIDIIPNITEVISKSDIKDNTWSLENLKRVADVRIEGKKLIINSDKVTYENGNLYVTLTEEQLIGAELVETDRDVLEQECSLSTIWQRGLDPLDLNDGVQWSEAILEEISSLQLIEEINNAVHKVSISATVEFDTVELQNGQSVLTYKLGVVV